MKVNPVAFANELIARFGDTGRIDHMKLQKLLYFADGWFTGLTGTNLFSERPQVWRYGPVYNGVYHAFSSRGKGPIKSCAPVSPFSPNEFLKMSEAELQSYGSLLNWVWNEYGHKSGIELSDETHAPGTPWQTIAASRNYSVPLGFEIPAKEDWRYFSNLAMERGWKAETFKG